MSAIVEKLDEAAAATDATQALVTQARHRLESAFNGRTANGFGIYRDPAQQRDALRQCITELTAALATMTATAWPSEADYDAADEAGL